MIILSTHHSEREYNHALCWQRQSSARPTCTQDRGPQRENTTVMKTGCVLGRNKRRDCGGAVTNAQPEDAALSWKSLLMEMAEVWLMMQHQLHDKASILHCTMVSLCINSTSFKHGQNEKCCTGLFILGHHPVPKS